MFTRFGHVTRVFLAKDRETGRAKGFAFVSFADRSDAVRACEKMDGCKCLDSLLKLNSLTILLRWVWSFNSQGRVCEEDYVSYARSLNDTSSYKRYSLSLLGNFSVVFDLKNNRIIYYRNDGY